ncbi:ComEA family DNA-binding protein [Planctomycetota bacterium]
MRQRGVMENKGNGFWTLTEESTIVILFGLVVIAMVCYSGVDHESGLAKRSSEFYCININQAGWEELDLLPGIGALRAQNIVEYRQSHGQFSNIDDIKKVSGIPDKVIFKIKDKIIY